MLAFLDYFQMIKTFTDMETKQSPIVKYGRKTSILACFSFFAGNGLHFKEAKKASNQSFSPLVSHTGEEKRCGADS